MTNHYSSEWCASLTLGFTRSGDKTALTSRVHSGPLTVQRPFYPEGAICHVYLLHPPGGVVAGDRLHFDVRVENASQALITTPAAGKFYRSAGGQAQQSVNLQVADNASLEWLPQESIVYEGASLHTGMDIDLADAAGFIGWEILALGRPASGEGFDAGQALLNWRIKRGGHLFYLEKQRLDTTAFKSRWGLYSHSSCGTLFACPTQPHHLQAVQALIGEHPGRGATQIGDMLICRALDHRADRLREFFSQVWALLRADIVGQNSCPPRIWAT